MERFAVAYRFAFLFAFFTFIKNDTLRRISRVFSNKIDLIFFTFRNNKQIGGRSPMLYVSRFTKFLYSTISNRIV